MAAEDEGRTEEPSEYKLEKARKEGRVAKSAEVSSALVLLFCVLVLVFLGNWILNELITAFKFYFSIAMNADFTSPSVIYMFFNVLLKCIIPVGAVAIVAGFLGNIVQTKGIIFSLKPIEPKFSKIVPKVGEYFKKTIFSGKGLFNIAKSIIKIVIIAVVGYIFIKKNIPILIQVIDNGQITEAIRKIASMCAQILIVVAVIFLVLAIPDYFVIKREFMEEMKMTKQEVKEEYKEMEGDPEVKGRLKQMQQQLLSSDVRRAVAESDVVITNPTHFAVALKYDQAKTDSPMVNAKGEDQIAQTIKQIARDNNIPIVENRPVARELYTNLKVGDIIPQIYFNVIATIYSQLDKFKNK
ncbi:MAG: flagellar biosynthesis protein FlhB [Spirochaetaceae bacterium]|nr:flagellar biosynthesis protein FlhB [Spirochaetaceae bacterium]